MNLEERINILAKWGQALGNEKGESGSEFDKAKELAFHHNGWFLQDSIDQALEGLSFMLEAEKLKEWASRYELSDIQAKRVGIIMAGNLPLVGMHDLVSTLLLGHEAVLKLSSDDNVLMPAALELLKSISSEMYARVVIAEGKLPKTDAMMTTGSNNTARYFEYYFKDRPLVMRKGRNGLAVLDGKENMDELKELGKDIFQFYGLGCRNISKILLPADFEIQKIFEAIFSFGSIIDHKKYANNYNYNRTIYLMNNDEFLDNDFFMLKKDNALASPVATLHYQTYKNEDDLLDIIKGHSEEVQCIVGHGNVPFGSSQFPELWDYADGVDTVEFLAKL